MILLRRFKVVGQSMEPTFKTGQRLLVSSLPYLFRSPKIGDLVVLKDPRSSRLILKRIVRKVGNKFFVAGDNPKSSTDSQTFGPISKEQISGKVIWGQ